RRSAHGGLGGLALCNDALVEPGARLQEERRAGCLPEVEVVDEVAENRQALTNVGAKVRPAVRSGVEAPASEEVVLDELRVRVEAERLVIDVPAPCVGTDHDRGNAQPVTVPVDVRRVDVVVEAAPVVP